MLKGKNVRLRLRDKEDLDFFWQFWNDLGCYGEYEAVQPQVSGTQIEKRFENPSSSDVEWRYFVIEKKDGTKIGLLVHYIVQPSGKYEIGYALVPNERGKEYGFEALQIMVDYLFLSKSIERVQATTDTRNLPSQRILEKCGFKREGTIRKAGFVRGKRQNDYLYSILREEWARPEALKTLFNREA
jgi:RimJ/RimL family protein N-acetyltransferase